jgi:hypothetical protein
MTEQIWLRRIAPKIYVLYKKVGADDDVSAQERLENCSVVTDSADEAGRRTTFHCSLSNLLDEIKLVHAWQYRS